MLRSVAAETKVDLLKAVPLFAGSSSRELERLGMLTDEVSMPAGRVLFNQGDPAAELFILVEGQVRVERHGTVIATRGPGEFFGEMALVSEGTRMASATCETDCRFLVLGHREFHSLMDEFPELKMRVLETLASRVRTLDTSAVH
jgi:CRP-like cAMP-binding protein